MKNWSLNCEFLVAALVLGCLTEVIFAVQGSSTSARHGVFEFNDDQGNCWRWGKNLKFWSNLNLLKNSSCAPGLPCVRCTNERNPRNPQCPPPNCDDPASRGTLSPSLTLRFYYQCMPDGNGNWVAVKMECPCDLLFDPATQQCTYPFAFMPTCDFTIADPTVIDCKYDPAVLGGF